MEKRNEQQKWERVKNLGNLSVDMLGSMKGCLMASLMILGESGVLEGSDTPRLLEELVKEILRMLDL